MRLIHTHIQRFRCVHDLELDFTDLTILVGANGSGKSSVLHALNWFFSGGPLDIEDVSGKDSDATVSVSCAFTDFSDADREALGSYVVGDEATFWRTWSEVDGEKLTGRGIAYPPFEEVRRQDGAAAVRSAYTSLREERPDLDLPSARSADRAREAMTQWEGDHPDQLEPATTSATHLFGFTGQPKLAGRFDFVLVPAVSDVEHETRDARGTLLRQLLDRSTADQERVESRLGELERAMAEQVGAVVEEEHAAALSDLASRVTDELRQLVESGSVSLEMQPLEFRMPSLQVGMRVADGGIETDVGRQGHGFQRALLIAIVQELARVAQTGDPPALFLAMEEPELYQHPLQARHFATVLAGLPRSGEGAIQVAYATHSEHFVDPARYERLRRFRRVAGEQTFPVATVTAATLTEVAERLDGVIAPEEIARRVEITLKRTLAEAVFARAVLLVEGYTDDAVLSGIADRIGGFDAPGVAVVPMGGKTRLLVPWAILGELGVPVYVVFDGDADLKQRLEADGREPEKASAAGDNAKRENRRLLRTLGASGEDWPDTRVSRDYAVMRDSLEAELERSWPEMLELSHQLVQTSGDWREKSDDCYRQAARDVAADPPAFAQEIVAKVLALA